MTLNSRLPNYRSESDKIVNESVDSECEKLKIVNLAQRAFTDGVISIMQKGTVKTSKEAIREFNEDISDYYLDKNMQMMLDYFMSIIRENTKNGKFIIGHEDVIAEDLKNIVKAIYDMGFISGVTVGQDPIKLAVYLKNRETLENGKY